MERVSQSMAGRTAVVTLLPLSTHEILSRHPRFSTDERILRGGYPALWVNDIAGRDLILSNYYTTYVERDLRQLVQVKDLFQFNTFMRLCAGRIGTECNASALAVADDGTFSAYEIKSGQTYRPEYFDGLRYLKGLFPDTMTSSRVVYDGDQSNPSPTDGLMNYRAIGVER